MADTWTESMIREEPKAARKWPAGATFDPHNGFDSDANQHYTDLLAGPDPAFDPTRRP